MSELESSPRVGVSSAQSRRAFLKTVTTAALTLPSLTPKAEAAQITGVTEDSPAYARAIPQPVVVGTFTTHGSSRIIPKNSTTALPPVDYHQIRAAVLRGNINPEYQTNGLGMMARIEFAGWSGQDAYLQTAETRLKSLNPNARLARGKDGKPVFMAFLATMSEAFNAKDAFGALIGGSGGTGDPIFAFDQRPLLKRISEGGNASVAMATMGTYHPTSSVVSCPQCLDAPKSYDQIDATKLEVLMGYTSGELHSPPSPLVASTLRTPASLVLGSEDPRLAEVLAGGRNLPRLGSGSFAYIAPSAAFLTPVGMRIEKGTLYQYSPSTTLIAGIAELANDFSSVWGTLLTIAGSRDPLAWKGLAIGTIPGLSNFQYAGQKEVLIVSALVVDAPPTGPSLTVKRLKEAVRLSIIHSSEDPITVAVFRNLPVQKLNGTPDRILPVPGGKKAGEVTEIDRIPEFESEFYALMGGAWETQR